MNDFDENLEPVDPGPPDAILLPDEAELWDEEPPQPPCTPRFSVGNLLGGIVGWIVIVAAVMFVLGQRFIPVRTPQATQAPTRESLSLIMHMIQSRYLVGAFQMMKSLDPKQTDQLYRQSEMLNIGTVDQRLRYVVLAGEMGGAREALTRLDSLDAKVNASAVRLSASQVQARNILRSLYRDYAAGRLDAPSVSSPQKQLLRQEMGWFGDLALAPEGSDKATRDVVLRPAWRTAITFISVFVGVAGLCLLGLVGLLVLMILALVRRLRGGLTTGGGHGGVYAETFALWMLLFVGMSFGSNFVPVPVAWHLPLQGACMLLCLVALVWPVIRGVPWSVVRRDIGWTLGRRPWLEPFLGLPGYIMTLPILAVGLIGTFILMKIFGGFPGMGLLGQAGEFSAPETAAHPIVGLVANGTWWDRLLVLWVASFVAPIVEETMFRGVLYRHLREVTGDMGWYISVMLSGVLVSFIFAAIHPQGVVAVPALMAMAIGFTLMREWRETLLPAMVAHGLNNGLVMGLLILVLGA